MRNLIRRLPDKMHEQIDSQTNPQNTSQASWINNPWVGFDTETTGVSTKKDRLVTAAAVTRRKGAVANQPDTHHTWLADPGVPIPPAATSVHGITTEYARTHGHPIEEVLEQVNATLAAQLEAGNVVVIFNAGYDLPLLEAESRRHNVATLQERLGRTTAPIVDPLVLDRALVKKRRGKRRLADLAPAYGVTLPSDTHQAHVDAALTLDLLAAQVKAHPQLQQLSAAELHEYQQESHAAWAKDFESFLRSRGRDTRISRTWF